MPPAQLFGEVSYKCKENQQTIDNFYVWLEVFLNYQKTLVNAHGLPAYFATCDYIAFMQGEDKKCLWPCLYNFDVDNR